MKNNLFRALALALAAATLCVSLAVSPALADGCYYDNLRCEIEEVCDLGEYVDKYWDEGLTTPVPESAG